MNEKEQRKRTPYKRKQALLSKKVIFAAIRGEERALHRVLVYYDKYINRLSSRELYDCYGNIYVYQDPVLKTELQNKLIAGILKFRAGEQRIK